MAPKTTGFAKEELQDMVNFGAASIFQMGDEVQEEDIDNLILEGKRKADELAKQAENKINKKLNLTDFQLDSCNLYQFEDVDYLEKRKEQMDIVKSHVIQQLD